MSHLLPSEKQVTVEEFGRQIKSKYPEYNDLTDEQVGKATLERYPEYHDLVISYSKQPEILDTFLEGHGVLRGISNIAGPAGIGKAVAQSIFLKFTPEGKDLIRQVSEGKIAQEDAERIIGKSATTREIISSALQIAATIGLAGAPAGIAKSITGQAVKTVGLPITKTIGGAALQGAGIGAASGVVSGIGDDKEDIKGLIGRAITGGIVGGAVGAAFGTLRKGVELLTKKAPEKIVGSALKSPKEEIKKSIVYRGESLPEGVLKRGIYGTDKQLYEQALDGLSANENKLQPLLKKSTAVITRQEVIDASDVQKLIERLKTTPGLAEQATKVEAAVAQLPEKMNLSAANQIKRNLYKALGDTAFKLDPSLGTVRKGMKAIAKVLKNQIEEKATNTTVKSLNQEIGFYLNLRDAALDNIAKSLRSSLVGFGGIATGAAGAGIGGLLKGGPGVALGAAAAVGARQAAGTTLSKTGAAVFLDRLGQRLDKLPVNKIAPLLKAFAFNLSKLGLDVGFEDQSGDEAD